MNTKTFGRFLAAFNFVMFLVALFVPPLWPLGMFNLATVYAIALWGDIL